ncbi:MAG: DNA polymerase III subunit delta' [Steroidobacteraceae bacterium]
MSGPAESAANDAPLAPPAIDFLPWQVAAQERVGGAIAAGRLPHGLLLQGPAGVGKERFASAFAAALFCTDRAAGRFEPCRACPDCQLSLAGTHPDLHWIRPLEDKKTVGVDQVREACADLAMTSMRRGYRVAILVPAERMTTQAQNALLKTLEEPAPRTVLMLVAARPSVLLPTLRSRCQRVEIAHPESGLALRWLGQAIGREAPPRLLAVAGGAPFRALALAPHFADLEQHMTGLLDAFLTDRIDVTRAAADLQGEGLPARLDWLEAWLGNALRRRVGAGGDETGLTFRAGSPLQRAPAELNITAAFQLLDRLREARRLLEGSSSAPLVVETLLLDLRAALRPR